MPSPIYLMIDCNLFSCSDRNKLTDGEISYLLYQTLLLLHIIFPLFFVLISSDNNNVVSHVFFKISLFVIIAEEVS